MMKHLVAVALLGAMCAGSAGFAAPADIPAAIYSDPAPDAANPAKMAVLHIPTHGVEINGVAYVPAGAGPHPAVILCHGLPGNEKNLDLAQALRRAGWTVITFNYRGSWGSPGNFRFAQNLEDADAVLAYARDPANAAKLRIDPSRIALAGHSMGGWVTALTAAHDNGLIGAVMISAGNIGLVGSLPRPDAIKRMADNGAEALAGTNPETMADEIIANRDTFDFSKAASRLADTRLLVLTSDDGLAYMSDALAAGIRATHGTRLTTLHVATDHGWSDNRIRLESEIIKWLEILK
jgi:pimeloyl-ACP methyl ester carboxylesterase